MNQAYLHLKPFYDSINILGKRDIKSEGKNFYYTCPVNFFLMIFTLRPVPEMSKQFNFLKERRYPIPTSVILGLPVRPSKVN